MLAIISDLHLCDGTATPQNIRPNAFDLFYQEIYQLALLRGVEKIEIVLLGDVFDLLRTERWFERADGSKVAPDIRPWGRAEALTSPELSSATLDNALAIASEIAENNRDALASLRGATIRQPDGLTVRRLYLPGNHDRLFLLDPRLQTLILTELGVDPRSMARQGVSTHRLALPEYGLLARHGHEWDPWNFEPMDPANVGVRAVDPDFLLAPIGDPITTELVARLPFELERRLASNDVFDKAALAHVIGRMQRIEDVRPLLASFRWAFFEADCLSQVLSSEQAEVLRSTLTGVVRDVTSDFRQLPYYDAWMERHGHSNNGILFSATLLFLSTFRVSSAAPLIQRLEQFSDSVNPHDTCRKGALEEELNTVARNGFRHVVYGHTHQPLQAALRVDPAADWYLNSGTWRRREFATDDNRAFLGTEHFSYVVFYTAEETKRAGLTDGPSFELWRGSRNCAPIA